MGLNCLLVSVNQAVVPYPVYPLGVAHLCGALREAGHVPTHFDLLADGGRDGLERLLRENSYELIGLSIRNLDTVDSSDPHGYLPEIAETAQLIRRCSAAVMVLGGSAFSIMPGEVLAYLQADYGVVGEGELLLPWLADELAAGRRPEARLLYSERKDDSWPQPIFSPSSLKYYITHGGMLNIQTKRGCPHRCAYCSYPTIEGRTMRYRDPEETAAEVGRLSTEHGARFIFFTDSVFNDAAGHFRLVAEALIKNGNTTPWCAFFRPQNLDREDLLLMKRAGLAAMEVGTDAASDRTLAALDKGFSFEQVLATNRLALEAEIPCAHFVMLGGPDENRQTLNEGLANLESLGKSLVFAFTGIRILPGTSLAQRAVAEGVIEAGQPLLEPIFYSSPQLAGIDLERELTASFAGRLDRIYPVSEAIDQLTMLHRMGHVGPLWDYLLRPRTRRR
ncbi:MAG TPA: radical SAM protein [Desulfurivibrio alkaliphilus]|uniref:Radical SAM protein n=1 Tax=Desulfurivibrio alkaliphilus TaxID=427923 RepID=A0A7C2TL59_9BACT|nr:radical SAM protein [Desulfurivibrio alkaliphilus]